ncbi:molybdopterin-guanine dinucleotide biosynthesis protein B [Neobacillus jeddahensis]|uniref:molybdopterin-guanine dinucleotide biosynthesis protein B n=1 Tax=Neobacillus jeddahensis TaxID=1461580 RepID=UPI00069457FB|nr:molybdopterin-guanine dinucleotide biosynthesis protein B [Neobacillus jeddahensis]
MALVKPFIFQIVGYQNSGKTTFTTKLIETLTARELKIVTIKHHGHGGKPDSLLQKDSVKHLASGATASIVEGEGRLILQADNGHYSLEHQMELLEFFNPDVILIEGYKQGAYPKLLLLREGKDVSLLDKVSHLAVVGYWNEEIKDLVTAKLTVPIFPISDERLLSWISEYIQEQIHSN